MKISKEKLTERLMERSGLERSQVERELQELIQRIRNSAGKGKALEIREFGMFYYSREGELQFAPAEELKTEVNFRYAGMEPVELAAERQPSQVPVESPAEEMPDPNEPKPKSSRPFAGQAEPSESRAAIAPAASGSKNGGDPAGKGKLDSGPGREKDPMSIFVIAVTVIMILVTGIIITLESGFLKDPSGAETQAGIGQNTDTPGAEAPEVLGDPLISTSAETATGGDPSEGTEGAGEAGLEEDPLKDVRDESVEPENLYGLHGSVRSMEGRLYAVILHSVRGEQRAERIREELSEEGYRVMIRPVESKELGMMWRIGLGQFPTVPDAQQAVSELPQEYQDNHFIGLIQQD